MAISICLCVTSMANAQDSDGIPKKVLKELEFMVGKWETEMYEDGKKVGTSTGERKWAPGKYCLLFSASLDVDGDKFEGTGISGWTRKGRAVVEHWYGSDGSSLTVRYPLNKMKNGVWEGTFRLVEADGQVILKQCKLQKGKDEWIFTTEWEEDGEKKSSRNLTRKVKE